MSVSMSEERERREKTYIISDMWVQEVAFPLFMQAAHANPTRCVLNRGFPSGPFMENMLE